MWIRRSVFTPITLNRELEESTIFFTIILEKFLRASREVDVSLHVPANRCMEEPLEGLPEGFQGKPQR